MLTSSHAYWSARLGGRGRARAWVVAGGVAPDLPALLLAAWGLGHGARGAELIRRTYQRPGPERVHRLAHSALVPLTLVAAGAGPRRRALALGWAGHLAGDLVTHHDDAWPHLWPLSDRRLRSPVSYWQPRWHGRAYAAAESAALLAAALTARRPLGRAAALTALAAAALPFVRPRTWTAHGCATPEAPSGPRAPGRPP